MVEMFAVGAQMCYTTRELNAPASFAATGGVSPLPKEPRTMANHTPNQSKTQPNSFDGELPVPSTMGWLEGMCNGGSNGFVPDRDKALAYVEALYKQTIEFYSTYTDEQIEAHNTATRHRIEAYHRALDAKRMVERSAKRTSAKPGYVYLLKADNGTYKIGKAKDPANRLKTFSVKLPYVVEYVALIKTHDMSELESDLHEFFDYCRLDGEWFALSPDDVELIKEMAE